MSTPRLGETHDVVIWPTGGGSPVGLMVLNYRFAFAPALAARFGQGHLKGVDRNQWFSWMQSRFDGGSGQLIWSESSPTNKFAESHLIHIGAPFQYYPSETQVGMNFGVSEVMDDNAVADVSVEPKPVQTSGEVAGLFSSPFYHSYPLRAWMFEWSDAPLLVHGAGAFIYTAFPNSVQFTRGVQYGNALTRLDGKWVTVHTFNPTVALGSAVYYSGTIIANVRGSNYKPGYSTTPYLWQYGPESAGSPATWHTFIPSGQMSPTAVYDKRLWGASGSGLFKYQPGLDSLWVSIGAIPGKTPGYVPGSEQAPNAMVEFNGKLYIGRRENLSVYDAGTIYLVENFDTEEDDTNFNLMLTYHGALYFNIKHKLYRLTTGGLLEIIQTPWTKGFIYSGSVVEGELFIVVGSPLGPSDVWIFNAQTGGTRLYYSQWLRARPQDTTLMHPLTTVTEAFGHAFIVPAYDTTGHWSTHFPVIVRQPLATKQPVASGAFLISSMIDQGMPSVDKIHNRVVVDYALESPLDQIDVYYSTSIGPIEPRGYNAFRAIKAYGIAGNDAVDILEAALIDRSESGSGTYAWDFNAASPAGEIWGFGAMSKVLPAAVTFVFDENGAEIPAADYTLAYWSNHFKNLNWGNWSEIDDVSAGATYSKLVQTSGTVGSRRIRVTFWIDHESIASEYKFKLGNGNEVNSQSAPDQIGPHYWMILLETALTGPKSFKPKAVYVGVHDFASLRDMLDWTLLGSITGESDFINTRKALSFPIGFNAQGLVLRFDMKGDTFSRPVLRRYELEYLPMPSEMKVISLTTQAADGIQNRLAPSAAAIEHSGSFIATTLNSLIGSGIPHVIGLSWPTPHTIRALVKAVDPGVQVPAQKAADFPGAQYSIRLEEL